MASAAKTGKNGRKRHRSFSGKQNAPFSLPETGDAGVLGAPLSYDAAGGFPPADPRGDVRYAALDRFDRLRRLHWGQRNYGFVEMVGYYHGRLGHRLARQNRPTIPWPSHIVTTTHDEVYVHDRLYRLREMGRGKIPARIAFNKPPHPPKLSLRTFGQTWQLDTLDNWNRLDHDDDGDGTTDMRQQRTHDRSNRITTVQSGAGGTAKPEYDAAGNMTRIPQVPNQQGELRCVYDGWNRLVQVLRGNKRIADYEYDGLGRRIVKRVYDESTRELIEGRHYYYSQDWQVLQERVDQEEKPPWETKIDRQYVWGVRGQDDVVRRHRYLDEQGQAISERLYAVGDANSNVVSLYDVFQLPNHQAERVVERIEYDPYGQPHFMDPNFNRRGQSNYDWNILFGGYYYEKETGLYHVRHRMYHPLYGRWLQTNPSGFTDSFNLYQYGLSSPVTYVDPTGEILWWVPFLALGLVLAGAQLGHTPELSSTAESRAALDAQRQAAAAREVGSLLSLPIFGGVFHAARASGWGLFGSGAMGGVSANLTYDVVQAGGTGDPLYNYRDEYGNFSPVSLATSYAVSAVGGGSFAWGIGVALPWAIGQFGRGAQSAGSRIGGGARWAGRRFAGPRVTPRLYWHRDAQAITKLIRDGVLVQEVGAGGKYWATSRTLRQLGWQQWRIGGRTTLHLRPPFIRTKAPFTATYELTPAEVSLFRRAWGPRFSFNIAEWWKGAVGQYYYRPLPATVMQRVGEAAWNLPWAVPAGYLGYESFHYLREARR